MSAIIYDEDVKKAKQKRKSSKIHPVSAKDQPNYDNENKVPTEQGFDEQVNTNNDDNNSSSNKYSQRMLD